jgi:hypothetical protein
MSIMLSGIGLQLWRIQYDTRDTKKAWKNISKNIKISVTGNLTEAS